MRKTIIIALGTIAASPALAVDKAEVLRKDAENVTVSWSDSDPVDVYLSATPTLAGDAKPAVAASRKGMATLALPSDTRQYVILRDGGDKSLTVVAERLFPLEKGSNFRDVGGYVGAGGKTVKWGKIFRSGALPMLSDRDYALLSGLKVKSIVDLRSLEEREVAATELDDRTDALFLSNDYSLKPLMRNFAAGNGENVYVGMEKLLKPQYRAIFSRLLADDGAVMYHCSAGQDRTGMASALILTALGVNRETIIKDYHLSTPSRRPQWELPALDPADHPNNPIVQYYAAAAKKPGGIQAEPLYSKSGVSHLVQFFAYLDTEYGSVEGYMAKELGVGPDEIAKLRALYLEA
jgi:protein-tyrosine phosphatase